MTPEQINAAMPIGQPMTVQQIARAIGGEVDTRRLASYMQKFRAQLSNEYLGGGARYWTLNEPLPVKRPPEYPCNVETYEREYVTPQGNTRVMRITLPKMPEARQ